MGTPSDAQALSDHRAAWMPHLTIGPAFAPTPAAFALDETQEPLPNPLIGFCGVTHAAVPARRSHRAQPDVRKDRHILFALWLCAALEGVDSGGAVAQLRQAYDA